MAFRKRIYQATEAGLQALESYAVVRADMRMCEEEQIGNWLHELETRGPVSSHADPAESDLDSTGSLSLAALRAGHKTPARRAG